MNQEESNKLNERISNNFCEICDTKIKNKEKHIKTAKHNRNVKDTLDIVSGFNNLLNQMASGNITTNELARAFSVEPICENIVLDTSSMIKK